jgi:ABC-2 type transport system permease protein
MRDALAYEWKRITTVRSTYWFSGMTIAFAGLIAFFIAISISSSDFTSDGISNYLEASTLVVTSGGSVFIVPVLSAAFCAVMGAMSFGHEYRYGTIKQTLTAIPDRITAFAAKFVMLVGWLLALMLVVVLVDIAMGALFLTNFSLGTEAVRPIVNFVLYCVGFGIAGFALAAIFRNLAGALVAVLVYPFVLESFGYNIVRIVRAGTFDKVANLFPAAAGRRSIFSPYEVFANPTTGSDVVLHVWSLAASTVVFWCGLLILTAVALVLFLKRDA